MMTTRNSFTRQAKMLKAPAPESRLTIADRLSRGEYSVSGLRALVCSDLSSVSKHLALLRTWCDRGPARGNHGLSQSVNALRLQPVHMYDQVLKERKR